MLIVTFLNCGNPFWFFAFLSPTLLKNLNVMSVVIFFLNPIPLLPFLLIKEFSFSATPSNPFLSSIITWNDEKNWEPRIAVREYMCRNGYYYDYVIFFINILWFILFVIYHIYPCNARSRISCKPQIFTYKIVFILYLVYRPTFFSFISLSHRLVI